jgi:RND family efflux transporter MFP subunit
MKTMSLRWSTHLLAVFMAAFAYSCTKDNVDSWEPTPVLTVEVVSPANASWSNSLMASGEVAAWQEAIIGTELAGIRLERVMTNVGDTVRKGQLLAQFNEDTLRAELAGLDANVATAKANYEKAKADGLRAEKLETTKAISQQTILDYRTQAQTAQARLKMAVAQRNAQVLRLRYARVVAPDDGVISSRTATVGAVSSLGSELFRLVRRNRLEWRAEVPAESLRRLKPHTAVTLQTLDGGTVSGILRQLAPTIDIRTNNGIAYVDLPDSSDLAAGMYLTGRFALTTRDVVAVPESAVVMRDGNHYLMRVDTDNRVHSVKVSTGQRYDSAIEILGSIKPEERFIKSGGALVSTGDLVQVATADGPRP